MNFPIIDKLSGNLGDIVATQFGGSVRIDTEVGNIRGTETVNANGRLRALLSAILSRETRIILMDGQIIFEGSLYDLAMIQARDQAETLKDFRVFWESRFPGRDFDKFIKRFNELDAEQKGAQ